MAEPFIEASENLTEKPSTNLFKMHTHSTHELYCFLEGSANYYVEGSVYKLHPGDLLIMRTGEAHTLLINKMIPYRRIVINFNFEALIGDTSENIKKFVEERPLGKNNRYSAKDLKEKNILLFLNKIVETENFAEKQLYITLVLNELSKTTPKMLDTTTENDMFMELITYINSNLSEDINLDILSAKFFISKTHLIRLFKKYTGSTVWNYLLVKRLILARELLRNGERPTSVYLKAGFNDYSSFFKAYKSRYKISPKEDYVK